MNAIEPKTLNLHGRSVTYAEAGSGPVLLLIHGMAGTYENWRAVIEPLARSCTVVAPDLPGHGASEPGAGDYSLGSLAAGVSAAVCGMASAGRASASGSQRGEAAEDSSEKQRQISPQSGQGMNQFLREGQNSLRTG